MIRSGAMLARHSRSTALSLAAFSLIVSPTIAQAVECPDSQTVGAARLLEFKTMMMVVGLRCKSVGVMMADHNDEMAATRSTMFEEANRRVRSYITENNRPAPVSVTPEPPVATETVAKAAQPRAVVPATARGKVRGRGPAKGRGRIPARRPLGAAARAAAAAPAPAPASARAAAPATGPAKPARAVLAKAAPASAKPAPRSKREDPYEMYLTRVGTTYGMGDNSPGTCKKYDALASFLADPTTPNRALSMAADRMVSTTILEKQRNCPTNP